MAVAITTTLDPALARIRLSINMGLNTITKILVDRKTSGESWVTLRAGASYASPGGIAAIDDYEAPFDTPVIYRATQVTPVGATTGLSAWATLPSQQETWLKDPAYPTRNMRLDEVTSLEEMQFVSRAGVFAVIDRPRPVVVAARRAEWTGVLSLTTATDDQRIKMDDLLKRGQVLLLSTPKNYGIGNMYVHVGDVQQTRVTPLVTEPTRQWQLPLTAVDRPEAISTMLPGITWADVKAKYPTWQALTDTDMTWNQLLESTP